MGTDLKNLPAGDMPTFNDADAPALDLDGLELFYPDPAKARNVGAGLPADLRLERQRVRHSILSAMKATSAAETLQRLPEPDEIVHIISRGFWNAWALVPAMLALAQPHPIDRLYLASLTYSRDNAEQLVALIDAGQIRRVTMVVSCYFQSNEKDVVDWLAGELKARGSTLTSARNHAKIIAAGMGPGRQYIVETSANLRSSRNVEQFTVSNSLELFNFHAGWMDEIVRQGGHR